MFKNLKLLILLGLMIPWLLSGLGCTEEESGADRGGDTTKPEVVASYPLDQETGVSRTGPFWILFSESMNQETVENNLQFYPEQFNGLFFETTWEDDTVFIHPHSYLNGSSVYNIIAGAECADMNGNEMGSGYSLNFTTTSEEDTEPPRVVSTTPANGQPDVTAITNIEITFSEPVIIPSFDWETQTFLQLNPQSMEGEIEKEGDTVRIIGLNFPQGQLVEATVTPDVTDLAGNPLIQYTFSFTTGIDDVSPVLNSSVPDNGETGVSTDLSLMVFNFSEPVDQGWEPGPGDIDLRIMFAVNSAGYEPWFSNEGATLNVPLRGLTPGCDYWVDFRDLTDLFNNPIDPNPTSYHFTTPGAASYFPVADGNKWYFFRSLGNGQIRRITGYDSGTGEFDVVFEEEGQTDEVWHMRITATQIQHLGRDEYNNGSYVGTMSWNTPLTFFKLPVTDHLGEEWDLFTEFQWGGETDTLSGTVSMQPALSDITLMFEENMGGTLKDVAKHQLDLSLSIEGGAGFIIDTWLCPGVGWIKIIETEDGSTDKDTLTTMGWDL